MLQNMFQVGKEWMTTQELVLEENLYIHMAEYYDNKADMRKIIYPQLCRSRVPNETELILFDFYLNASVHVALSVLALTGATQHVRSDTKKRLFVVAILNQTNVFS